MYIDVILNSGVNTDSTILSEASHRKLLLQAEEAIETQLNDAQRKVTTVQKVRFLLLQFGSYVVLFHAVPLFPRLNLFC